MAISQTAMVMAAGLGTRMRPLTNDRPKPLVELGGKPLIEYALEKLRIAGVGKAIINVHYLPDMLENYLKDHVHDIEIFISDERDLLLETGGGLVKALPQIKDDPFFVTNSDAIWTDGDEDALTRLAKAWDGDAMDALLLLVPRENTHSHKGVGDFSTDSEQKLIRRGEADSAPYIYSGVQLISHRLLRDAPEGPFSTNILWNRAIAEGRAFGLVHEGQWFDIGSPAAIAPTEDYLKNHG
jgi:N-acetyl-alpha-D-muramate 1-phosphate uridylyltransferase